MIRILKLQKAVIILILGVISLIVYKVMSVNEMDSSIYALELAGLLFIIGALMLLYPILFAQKDKEGKVQLNPDKHITKEDDEQTP